MSKAKSPEKVLRAALKRIDKRWTKGAFVDVVPDGKGGKTAQVCLIGAITGDCAAKTQAQKEAMEVIAEIIQERFPNRLSPFCDNPVRIIPSFNDNISTSLDEVEEVIKLGIIRLETGYLDDEEVDDLLEGIRKKKEKIS